MDLLYVLFIYSNRVFNGIIESIYLYSSVLRHYTDGLFGQIQTMKILKDIVESDRCLTTTDLIQQ